ncbi:ROLLING AND ERECT LEAF 2-like protein [Drosera capensis]
MGCAQSKIENEEAVARCKDRKQHMRDAVAARNAFAAAHCSYAVSLKNTGAALSDYAHSEVVQNPNTLLPPSSSTPPQIDSRYEPLPPPPPPVPPNDVAVSPPPPPLIPLQRAASMPEFVVAKNVVLPAETIVEDDEEEEGEGEVGLRRRMRNRGGGGGGGEEEVVPPPPPETPPGMSARAPPPPPEASDSRWDFFFNVDSMLGVGNLGDVEEMRREREEMERKALEERGKRSIEVGNGVVGEGSRNGRKGAEDVTAVGVEETVAEKSLNLEKVAVEKQAGGGKMGKRGKQGAGGGAVVKRGREGASQSAHEVSKMLEATRLHYHSNFADNRGHIDHSARVMRVITWNRSFRGDFHSPDEVKDDFDSEENETHATVLDKLLAWEKKLYDEVKAGELMKFEYQRKVALLNKQKKRNATAESLEKTKAAVSHLHTRYIVDMQSLDSTVSEINRLRDEQLYPKLVALVDEMATMWDAMQVHHENQLKISMALKLVDVSQSTRETTEYHHQRTNQLWTVVQEWDTQFGKMVSHQKEYIRALNHWLKLNLIPIESSLKEKVSSPPRAPHPPIKTLLLKWYDQLEKLPDEEAKSAIYNFAAVLHTILQQQEDEMKLRAKCDESRKDLLRKKRQFEDWYNKYMQKWTPPDDMGPDRAEGGSHTDVVTEKKLVVDIAETKLQEDEEAYQKQYLHVREKSLNSLKTRLPELFRAMLDFAGACSEMYRELSCVSQGRGRGES